MERSLAGIAGTTREPEISCISSLKRWLVCSFGIDDALPPTPLLDTDPLLNPNRSRSGGFKPTLVEYASPLRDGGYVIDFWSLG
jgi:hypothetical protein